MKKHTVSVRTVIKRLTGVDIEATRATLKAAGLNFWEVGVPGGRLQQIFVPDPDGVLVELNFRNL